MQAGVTNGRVGGMGRCRPGFCIFFNQKLFEFASSRFLASGASKINRGSNLSTTGDFPQMEDGASTILKIFLLPAQR